MNHELKLTHDHDLRITGNYCDESIRFDSLLGLKLGTGPGPPLAPSALSAPSAYPLDLEAQEQGLSDDSSADASGNAYSGVAFADGFAGAASAGASSACATFGEDGNADPFAGAPFVDCIDDSVSDDEDDEDYFHPAAASIVVNTVLNHEFKMTTSARGVHIPVIATRDRPGSSFYEVIIAIVVAGIPPTIDTFGTSGRVRGRLRQEHEEPLWQISSGELLLSIHDCL